jgi:hypothetical protein
MERWLFIHIMKTAGTSFRSLIESDLGGTVYPTRAELRQQRNEWYLPAPELLEQVADGRIDLAGRRVLCGHYASRLADALPGRWRSVIFLRDPVKRALSMIAHRHKMSQNRFLRFRGPRIADYLKDDAFIGRQITNYQTKVLAMDALDDVNRPYEVDDAAFERAREALFATDVVGLAEHFSESVRLFEQLSGLRLSSYNLHAGRSPAYHPTEEDIKAIRALVPYDFEIYRLAQERMRQQFEAA